VYTHELVRHRTGTAFSQTSGRYVRGDSVDIVFDPILEPVREEALELQKLIEERYAVMVAKMGLYAPGLDFAFKKKATSALRRFLPNGQSNEIGFSVNLRSLRHLIMLRTGRHAEWEIRDVFGQVYRLVKAKYPTIFADADEAEVDGLLEVTGMRMQPYETQGE
jgi:thymidylate synthase (FAD)